MAHPRSRTSTHSLGDCRVGGEGRGGGGSEALGLTLGWLLVGWWVGGWMGWLVVGWLVCGSIFWLVVGWGWEARWREGQGGMPPPQDLVAMSLSQGQSLTATPYPGV